MLTNPSRRIVVVLVLLVLAQPAYAQARVDAHSSAEDVDTYLRRAIAHADSFRLLRETDAGLAVLDAAIESLERGSHSQAARTLQLRRLRFLSLGGEEARARQDADVLIEQFRAQGDSAAWAEALFQKTRAMEALGEGATTTESYRDLLQLAVAVRDSSLLARSEMRLARRLRIEGELDAAAAHLERSNELYHSIGEHDKAESNLLLAGILDIMRGRREDALDKWRRCASATRDWKHKSVYVACLNNIAVQEALHGDPSVAMECWRSARDISLESGGRWRDSLRPSMNLALLLAEYGRFQEAESSLEASLTLTREKGYADLEAEILLMSAEVAEMRDDWPRSLEMNRQAVTLLKDRGDPQDRFWAMKGVALGLAAKDSVDAALSIFERLRPSLVDLPVENRLEYALHEMRLLTQAQAPAEALEVLGPAYRTAAVEGAVRSQLDLLLAGVEAHRALERPDSMIVALERAREVYETLRVIPTDPKWRESHSGLAYLIYPELARLRRTRSGLSATELHEMLQLYKGRTLLERITRPGEEASSEAITPVPMKRLQSEILRDGELMLDFFAGPTCSFLFVISKSSCELLEMAGADSIEARTSPLQELLRARPQESEEAAFVQRAAATVGNALLPSLLREISGVESVLFVPDGALLSLPLSALLGEESALSSAAIQWVPSAQLLARLRTGPTAARNGSILAMVPSGDALPGTRDEVNALAERFQNVEIRRLGEEARPDLRSEWSGWSVLHIASHARLVDQDPWRSAILYHAASREGTSGAVRELSAGERTPQLTAAEISESNMDTPLVVLSGCETMGGERFRGAGALGLSTAFLGAGARQVLATLWPVDDDATGRLVVRFYGGLARGLGAAQALRAAKAELRSRPETAHPFFWAGFVLVGDDPGELSLRTIPSLRWWIPLALALGTALALLALTHRRKRSREF